MISEQRRELGQNLFQALKAKFPEIDLVDISESPENPNDTWVNIIMPEEDDREIEIREFASEKSTEILLEYGHYITIASGTLAEQIT